MTANTNTASELVQIEALEDNEELDSQIINDYQRLKEKCDSVISKIKDRKEKKTKKWLPWCPMEKTNDNLKKHDLELILEVNKKAIEIQTEVAEQNEEIIAYLEEMKKSNEERYRTDGERDKKLEKIVSQAEENSRDLFRIQVLFVTGLLSLVIQIIQIFVKH